MLKRNIDQILKIGAVLVMGIGGIYVFSGVNFKPIYVIIFSTLGLVLWFGSYVLSNRNKLQKITKESRAFNILINVLTFAMLFVIFAIVSNKA